MTPSEAPILRSARLEDVEDIEALEVQVFGASKKYQRFSLFQLFRLDGGKWSVVEMDGKVRGYAIVVINSAREAWLLALTVDPDYRGRGYGSLLVKASQDRCLASGKADQLFVSVDPDNKTARHIYDDLGFVWVDYDEKYFGQGEPRDVLAYPLHHDSLANDPTSGSIGGSQLTQAI